MNCRIIVSHEMSTGFILISNGVVSYISAQETPLALSNIAGSRAAELRFRLEDAKTPAAALRACAICLPSHIQVALLTPGNYSPIEAAYRKRVTS